MAGAPRPQTAGEEIANAVSHGAGLAMGLAALPLLVVSAAWRDDGWQIVAGAIYATTLVLLYSASTVYHALPSRFPAKRLFRGLDHGAIYLLIAGTYTPFALGALRGPWGWSLLTIIWALAAGGIVLKMGLGFRYPRLSTAVYRFMGWLIVVALRPLYRTRYDRSVGCWSSSSSRSSLSVDLATGAADRSDVRRRRSCDRRGPPERFDQRRHHRPIVARAPEQLHPPRDHQPIHANRHGPARWLHPLRAEAQTPPFALGDTRPAQMQ